MTEIDTDILRNYAAARSRVAPGDPVTLIQIGRWHTILVSGRGYAAYAAIVLGIGSSKTADEFFKHDPPTPYEIESAIAVIEDELARARTVIVSGSMLVTTDKSLRDLARMAGETGANERVLGVETVEQLYRDLAATSLGTAVARNDVGPYTNYAATVLILRELMHHLRFSSLTLTT